MNTIKNLLINLCNLLVCACELFRYALIFMLALFSPKAVLAARLLAVESRLAACKHQIGQRKRWAAKIYCKFSPLMGLALKISGQVGRFCPPYAASHSQEMA